MPFFIIFSLLLAFLAHSQSYFLPWLQTTSLEYSGWSIALFSLLGGVWKKIPISIWHDGFAVGASLIWYAAWVPLFSPDAPMFYVFPCFFALLSGWQWLSFINRSAQFDEVSRTSLRYLRKLFRINTPVIAGLVLSSLLVPDQYLLFPVAMSLFIVRYTMERCLELIDAGL
jgi:hypothetical protein